MKRVLPSTIRRTSSSSDSSSSPIVLSSSRHGCRVFLCSFKFPVALVAAGTKRKGILRVSPPPRTLTLVGYYFYSVSSLVAAWTTTTTSTRRSCSSFHLRVVLYHRDCIARVYVIRIGPNLYGIAMAYYHRRVQFPEQERVVYLSLCRQHKVSHCYELENKVRVGSQFQIYSR